MKIWVYHGQTNIKVRYTEAIHKRRFRTTQRDINTVQEKYIHAILPCLELRREVCGFKKDIGVDLFELDLFPSLYIGLLFTDGHDTDTAKFEKVKVQDSVGLKYKFYKAMLKISSFWKGFSQSTKLDSRYTSEEERHSF